MKKIDVLLVDDQNLFRETVALLIRNTESLRLVGDFESGEALLSALPDMKLHDPAIAIIDLEMPGLNGIQLNNQLRQSYPEIRVIVLTIHFEPALITQLIDAKATAFLAKNCNKEELLMTITTVFEKGFSFSKTVLEAIRSSANHRSHAKRLLNIMPSKISERELEVLQLICEEYNSAEIGNKLCLSTRTVETYRNNLLLKTGCKNAVGLVVFAIKHNLFAVSL